MSSARYAQASGSVLLINDDNTNAYPDMPYMDQI